MIIGRAPAMRCIRLWAVAILLAASPAATGSSDLLGAWQAAQQHDPAFGAARAQWQAGQTLPRQARALLAPHVTASGSAGYVETDRNTRGAQFSAPGFGASNDAMFRTRIEGGTMTSWALGAQQPLYNAEREASAQQLGHQARIADWRLRAAGQELILRVAEAYIAVLLAEETLATVKIQKSEAARARDVVHEKFEAGALPVTDRHEAQARYDDVRAQEIAAQNEVELRHAAFRDATGKPAAALPRLAADTPVPDIAMLPLAAWLDRTVTSNPLIAMQELGEAIARDELRKFRALTSPTVDLVARIADERVQGSSGFGSTSHITAPTRTIGMQVTIPLYSGGMRGAKREEASALAEKARLDAAAVRQDMLQQTRAAWLAVSSGQELIHARQQAAASARARLEATETGLEVGARTTLDYLNAHADHVRARRAVVQARYAVLLDRLRLAASAGSLDEADIRRVNALLTDRP